MNNIVEIAYTRHAETRMQQRGIRNEDITLILAYATQIDDETWLMRERDAKRGIELCKRKIQALERLKSKKLVVRHGSVITAYPSRPDDQRRTLRRGRQRGRVR